MSQSSARNDSVCSLKRSNAVHRKLTVQSKSSPSRLTISTQDVDEQSTETMCSSPLSFSPSDSSSKTSHDEEHSEEVLAESMCPTGRMSWDAVVDLPQYLTVWAQKGLTACEIGQSLHRFVYGQDATLSNLVTIMVDAGKPYFEIGNAVLRNLDLRDDEGEPIWLHVPDGNMNLKAMPELWRLPPHQLSAFADSISGFTVENLHSKGPRVLSCPQPKRVQIVEPARLIRSQRATICDASE